MQSIKSLNDLQSADLEKIALAVEADTGHAITGLCESLADVKVMSKNNQTRANELLRADVEAGRLKQFS